MLLLMFIVLVSSCEKDDICVDGDTPLLVVGFFDATDSVTEKEVPSLRIRALDLDDVVNTFTDQSDLDSIGLPLKVNELSTSFVVINDYGIDEEDNETGTSDTITFNYSVRDKFVSRACGFIANYDLDITQTVPSTSNWIMGIEIVEPQVEFSNQIHVKVYH